MRTSFERHFGDSFSESDKAFVNRVLAEDESVVFAAKFLAGSSHPGARTGSYVSFGNAGVASVARFLRDRSSRREAYK